MPRFMHHPQSAPEFASSRRRLQSLLWVLLVFAAWLAILPSAMAQPRPYIGFVYPAGGQQGTTFQIRLGGQGMEDVTGVTVSGGGVSARILEYQRSLNPQEITLLNEQIRELKRASNAASAAGSNMMMSDTTMISSSATMDSPASAANKRGARQPLVARLEQRVSGYVNRPASVALANLVQVEVTIAPDAAPGQRELRVCTAKGVSNPLVFCVGQFPEHTRKPMATASYQVLGKEESALRKRPAEEMEARITLPCTLNGQIASGELNRYRFSARKGQRLVFTTLARQLIPYIADAVPGWFQPVIVLYDGEGKEVAYDDDYRFKPDPTLFFEVPRDGEYVLDIYDAIYRGREDFVYRITAGELPFVTSIFPMGARTNSSTIPNVKGWNLQDGRVQLQANESEPGVCSVSVLKDKLVSNPLPFALDVWPEVLKKEPNHTVGQAQKVTLPVMLNGRIEKPGQRDYFKFTGKSNELVVAEVYARRLDSPLDSVLRLTDAAGKLLAFSDDCEDLGSGLNTHHADSCLIARLPADGTYYVQLSEAAGNAGEEYGYRLRLSAPQADFALRVVPSSLAIRGKSSGTFSVHLIRRDGFSGPIKLVLNEPPPGFSAPPVTLSGTQAVARFTVKTDVVETKEPVNLSIAGIAKVDGQEVRRLAVPAEDRMQAFFWKHLVPAQELKLLVYDPAYQPKPKRAAPVRTPAPQPEVKPVLASTSGDTNNKPKFSKQQVAGRLRQLKLLYEEGLLTDQFYQAKVDECEAAR